LYFWIPDFSEGNRRPRVEGICKESSIENTWASEKGADGNEQYRADSSLAVCYAVAPGRRDGGEPGTNYRSPAAGRGSRPAYVEYVFVFLGSVIVCWLYTLTVSDQAHVTASESHSFRNAGTEGAE
jgi:hypothetical protein